MLEEVNDEPNCDTPKKYKDLFCATHRKLFTPSLREGESQRVRN
jgi:hypothetical protein